MYIMDMLKEYWDSILLFLFGSGGGFLWKYFDNKKKHRFDIVKELQEESNRLQKRLDVVDKDYEELSKKYYDCLKSKNKPHEL